MSHFTLSETNISVHKNCLRCIILQTYIKVAKAANTGCSQDVKPGCYILSHTVNSSNQPEIYNFKMTKTKSQTLLPKS